MTYDDMNKFFLNYIDHDITGRAIMLTGGWGSGKSHYVKNALKPFIENKENGKYKCIIVSLYGLSDISEISKSIYIELRTINKSPESETVKTAKVVGRIVGKTILNGLASKIGFNIGSIDGNALQEVYESVDLTNTLVVLEDFERTQINITELLGYINNLCENDGVKVLIVTNESELMQYRIEQEKITEYGTEKTVSKKVYSEKAQKYIRAKEKSISDTLVFCADFQKTTDSIIDEFNNEDLSCFKGCLKAPTYSIMSTDITNYREFKVACQKTCDLFVYMQKHSISSDIEFKKCIFIGLVYYLQKRLQDNELNFKANTIFDSDLSGSEIYPLMRFCYDYYNYQTIEQDDIIHSIAEYKDYVIFLDTRGYQDKDLKVLYSYYISSEKDINLAIENIYSRLDDINDISIGHYGQIINHLLVLKHDVHLNNTKIDDIINKIINNLKGKGEKFKKKHYLFSYNVIIEDVEGKKEYEELKKRAFDSLEYVPEDTSISDPLKYAKNLTEISNSDVKQYNPNKLIEKMQLDKAIIFITKLTPKTIDDLRYIFMYLNYLGLSNENLTLIRDFKDTIETLLLQNDADLDCIQKMQLKWTCNLIRERITNQNN